MHFRLSKIPVAHEDNRQCTTWTAVCTEINANYITYKLLALGNFTGNSHTDINRLYSNRNTLWLWISGLHTLHKLKQNQQVLFLL